MTPHALIAALQDDTADLSWDTRQAQRVDLATQLRKAIRAGNTLDAEHEDRLAEIIRHASQVPVLEPLLDALVLHALSSERWPIIERLLQRNHTHWVWLALRRNLKARHDITPLLPHLTNPTASIPHGILESLLTSHPQHARHLLRNTQRPSRLLGDFSARRPESPETLQTLFDLLDDPGPHLSRADIARTIHSTIQRGGRLLGDQPRRIDDALDLDPDVDVIRALSLARTLEALHAPRRWDVLDTLSRHRRSEVRTGAAQGLRITAKNADWEEPELTSRCLLDALLSHDVEARVVAYRIPLQDIDLDADTVQALIIALRELDGRARDIAERLHTYLTPLHRRPAFLSALSALTAETSPHPIIDTLKQHALGRLPEPCTLCVTLDSNTNAIDGDVPEAARELTPPISLGTETRLGTIARCRHCGTFYSYDYHYDYDVIAPETDFFLTRLTPDEALAVLDGADLEAARAQHQPQLDAFRVLIDHPADAARKLAATALADHHANQPDITALRALLTRVPPDPVVTRVTLGLLVGRSDGALDTSALDDIFTRLLDTRHSKEAARLLARGGVGRGDVERLQGWVRRGRESSVAVMQELALRPALPLLGPALLALRVHPSYEVASALKAFLEAGLAGEAILDAATAHLDDDRAEVQSRAAQVVESAAELGLDVQRAVSALACAALVPDASWHALSALIRVVRSGSADVAEALAVLASALPTHPALERVASQVVTLVTALFSAGEERAAVQRDALLVLVPLLGSAQRGTIVSNVHPWQERGVDIGPLREALERIAADGDEEPWIQEAAKRALQA